MMNKYFCILSFLAYSLSWNMSWAAAAPQEDLLANIIRSPLGYIYYRYQPVFYGAGGDQFDYNAVKQGFLSGTYYTDRMSNVPENALMATFNTMEEEYRKLIEEFPAYDLRNPMMYLGHPVLDELDKPLTFHQPSSLVDYSVLNSGGKIVDFSRMRSLLRNVSERMAPDMVHDLRRIVEDGDNVVQLESYLGTYRLKYDLKTRELLDTAIRFKRPLSFQFLLGRIETNANMMEMLDFLFTKALAAHQLEICEMIREHPHHIVDHLGLGREVATSFWKSKSPIWGAVELIDFLTRAGIYATYEPYYNMIEDCKTAESAWGMLEFAVWSTKKGLRIGKLSDFLSFLNRNPFIGVEEKEAVHRRAINLATELGLDTQ